MNQKMTAPILSDALATTRTDIAAGCENNYDNDRGTGCIVQSIAGCDTRQEEILADDTEKHFAGRADRLENSSGVYWFYIDYGKDSTYINRWISSRSDTAVGALRTALDHLGIPFRISSAGIISSIGNERDRHVDVDTETFVLSGRDWYFWFWSAATPCTGKWIKSTEYLGRTAGTCFYIALTHWEWKATDLEPSVEIDPNRETAWMNDGPFAL